MRLRLYRISKRGPDKYLGSYVSVASGLIPVEDSGENPIHKRGVAIHVEDGGERHALRGETDAAATLIRDVASAIAHASVPGLGIGLDGKCKVLDGQRMVLRAILDRLDVEAAVAREEHERAYGHLYRVAAE